MALKQFAAVLVLLGFPLLLSGQTQGSAASGNFDGNTWWAHVKFLADDSLEGRETGSEGLRKAQAYAVEQFQKAGLEPAGTKGFYQPVSFTQYQVDEANSSLALMGGGKTTKLSFADDAFISSRYTHDSSQLAAPLVFIGYGLKVPENHLDELAGLDVQGKVVVYISGSPSDVPTALASRYQTISERWKALQSAGAIGIIAIQNPASMDIPWARIALNRNHPSMNLAGAEFNETEGLKIGIVFNPRRRRRCLSAPGTRLRKSRRSRRIVSLCRIFLCRFHLSRKQRS